MASKQVLGDGMRVRADVEVSMVAQPHDVLHRPSPPRHSPLIVTSDPLLLEELLRLTSEIGLIADVAPDPAAARRWFPGAAIILVGLDMADACARAAFVRRPGVILIARSGDPAASSPDWDLADRLGADHVATMPAAEPWLLEQLARIESGAVAEVIAVLGGRGGAGQPGSEPAAAGPPKSNADFRNMFMKK